MKKIIFCMFAIMALLASCSQDDAFNNKSAAILGISAELPSQTRAINEKKYFQEGDQILLLVNDQQVTAVFDGDKWKLDRIVKIDQPTEVYAYYNVEKGLTVRPDADNMQHELLYAHAEVSPEYPLAELLFNYAFHRLVFEIKKSKESSDGEFNLESLTLKNKPQSKSPIYTDISYSNGEMSFIPGEFTVIVDKVLDKEYATVVEVLAMHAQEGDEQTAILSLKINGQDYENEINLSCLGLTGTLCKHIPVNLTLTPKPIIPYSYAVDLGLSVKWASFNVGAEYKATEYGNYVAWGETESKELYSIYTYKWFDSALGSYTKYCIDNTMGTPDYRSVLDKDDDIAHVKWSGKWRMPTQSEMRELITKCQWKWGEQDGVKGYTVTGTNGNSIFLPTGDYRRSAQSGIDDNFGYYWTSTTGVGSTSYCLLLNGYEQREIVALEIREMGCLVRPVY
ncbi:MAG: hypothetical protein SOZ58_07405 [Prevotella sp.]|nr:hypothetical protein [Prevotella sp.]